MIVLLALTRIFPHLLFFFLFYFFLNKLLLPNVIMLIKQRIVIINPYLMLLNCNFLKPDNYILRSMMLLRISKVNNKTKYSFARLCRIKEIRKIEIIVMIVTSSIFKVTSAKKLFFVIR